MYIWIGCKLPADFEKELRGHCLEANRQIGLDTVAFSLPQHVSLKISFGTSEHERVLAALTDYLSAQQAFSIRLNPAEQFGTILWLPVAENSTLGQLHNELDDLLYTRFGITQHEFDKSFLFHTTLFLDKRSEKLADMEHALSGFPLPTELQIDTFLLGLSSDGTNGSYRVVQTIEV